MDIELFILKFETESLKNVNETCLVNKYLDFDDLLKIGLYKNKQVKLLKILSTSLIKYGLMKYTNINQENLLLSRDVYNRPYLKNSTWKGDFNLSNTTGAICLAITRDGKIGIDIEKIVPIDYKYFYDSFSSSEMSYIESGESRVRRFYTIWTLKESYIKALGFGFYYDLKNFEFEIESKFIRLIDFMYPDKDSDWSFNTFETEGYQISICSNNSCCPTRVHNLSLVDLLKN